MTAELFCVSFRRAVLKPVKPLPIASAVLEETDFPCWPTTRAISLSVAFGTFYCPIRLINRLHCSLMMLHAVFHRLTHWHFRRLLHYTTHSGDYPLIPAQCPRFRQALKAQRQ